MIFAFRLISILLVLMAGPAFGFQHNGTSFVPDTVYIHDGTSFAQARKFMHNGTSFEEIELGGGGCDNPTVILELLNENSQTTNLSGTRTIGNGLYFSDNFKLYSITLKTADVLYNNPVYRMRIGTSTDQSTTYIAESDAITVSAVETEYEFIFSTQPDLSANVTYYFTVSVEADGWANFRQADSEDYNPPGCEYCGYIFGADIKYNADQTPENRPLYLRIKGCVQ